MIRRLAGALAMGALVAVLAGCGEKSPPPAARALAEDRIALGRAIYNYRCYFCHGYSGNAQTLAATYMVPKPRNFTASSADDLPQERILAAIRNGRPGTGMKSFAGILTEAEMRLLAEFVFDEFVVRKAANTRYHTPENGWYDHERYRVAFPFALGQISLARDVETLSSEEKRGRQLYLDSCISCHDRGRPDKDPVAWDARPLSFPRNNYDHRNPIVDATTSATPYHLHDRPPQIADLTPLEREGEELFQNNCAFCHAADGTGKNWIGSFLEPHPRNLTDPASMAGMTKTRLRTTIRNGLPGTSMPAWKSVLSDKQITAIIAYVSRAFHPVKE